MRGHGAELSVFTSTWPARQLDCDYRPAISIPRGPYCASVVLDDLTHDRKTHPGAMRFGRIEGVEDSRHVLVIYAFAGVADCTECSCLG